MTSPIHARVEKRQGRSTLLLNDQPEAPLIYALTDCPGSRYTWEELPTRNIALFGQLGFRLFQCGLWLRDMVDAKGNIDLTIARRQIAGVRAACPNGAVMFRLHVHPPLDWCEKNPDECVGYFGTEPAKHTIWGLERPVARDQDRPLRASIYSKKWMDWVREHLAKFCRELTATPEGEAVFCFQLAYGVYGEWHQFGFFCFDPDTGVAATSAYREWLGKRYQTDAALATAWSQPNASLSTAIVPGTEARAEAHAGILRDPIKGRATADYFTFQHEVLVDTILELGKIVKESWSRPIVTATFYGYFYCLFGRQAAGGHLAMDRILASPHIDSLCMTPSYTPGARAIGGPGHGRAIMAAVRRAGKLCLDEMDQPTIAGNGCPWDKSFKSTISDDAAMLRRNIMQPITRGGGAWWFDFGPVSGLNSITMYSMGGWWDDERLAAESARLFELATSRHGKPFTRPADVLIIHDPWSFIHTASRPHDPAKTEFGVMPISEVDPVSALLTDGLFEAIQSSGVVFDDALLSEIGSLDFTPYRMVIFATTPVLTHEQRQCIRQRIAQDGRHVVMLGYCGWSDGRNLGANGEADLLGSPVVSRMVDAASTLAIDGNKETISIKRSFEMPVFAGGTAATEIIGQWPDGSASAICRKGQDATWWAFALPPCQPSTLRALAKRAGCRIINEHNEVTFLGDGFLVVHTMEGGERTLHLPNGKRINTRLPARSTIVFDAENGEILMG